MNDLQRRARRRRIAAWVKRNAPPVEPGEAAVEDDGTEAENDVEPPELAADAAPRASADAGDAAGR